MYYHINPSMLTIIAGPFELQSEYVKNLTHCGNPELLNLADYNLVPEVREALNEDDEISGAPVVTVTAVTIPKANDTIPEIKRRKRERIAAICSNRVENPVTVDGVNYNAAAPNRALLHELLGHAERNPTLTTVVKQKNGTPVALTLTQMRALVAALAAHTAACYANEKALYDSIGAATTRAQLRAINLQAGWPS